MWQSGGMKPRGKRSKFGFRMSNMMDVAKLNKERKWKSEHGWRFSYVPFQLLWRCCVGGEGNRLEGVEGYWSVSGLAFKRYEGVVVHRVGRKRGAIICQSFGNDRGSEMNEWLEFS